MKGGLGLLLILLVVGGFFALLILIGLPGLIIHYWRKYREHRAPTRPTDQEMSE